MTRLLLLLCALLALPVKPASAQERPVSLALIEEWLKARVPSSRIQVYVTELGVDFAMDSETAARLAQAGASPELIVTLEAVAARRPVEIIRAEPRGDGFSRSDLMPIYFDRGAFTLRGFLESGFVDWSDDGGTVFVYRQAGRSDLAILPPALPGSPFLYGASLSVGDFGVEAALQLHEPDWTMFLAGLAFEPFIPLGPSGYRLIAGLTGWLSYTRITLTGTYADRPTLPVRDIEYTGRGFGGAGRVGLAYHYRPGFWVYAESQYRVLGTLRRQMRLSTSLGETWEIASDEIPWSKLGSTGFAFRIGLGWDFRR